MKNGCLAIGVAALVIVGIAAALFVWLSPKPTFHVVNVDGQAVEVVPWLGGPSITVPCGGGSNIDTSGAPGQPWTVTVTSAASHRVLLRQDGSGPMEVIVRKGGVLMGAPPPSVGPVGVGCSGAT
jgi:hypothetical protein